MFSKRILTLKVALVLALAITGVSIPGLSHAAKPTTAAQCKQCHKPADDVVRGTMVSVSDKFKTINVAVGSLVWVIKYGDDLKLTGTEKLMTVPKDKEIGITFTGGEKTPYAVSLSVKPPAKIAPEKLVSVEDMSKLVTEGTEKGKFVLVDSRPAPRYNEGHLPYAVSMPNDKFDSLKDKILPKEKDKLVIFYCAGPT